MKSGFATAVCVLLIACGCGTETKHMPGAISEVGLRVYTPPNQDAFQGVATLRVTLRLPDASGDFTEVVSEVDVRTSEINLSASPAEGAVVTLEGIALDGQRVVSAGQSAPFDLDPERATIVDLLFARRGEFARLLGDLGHARFGHTATALADGRVLVFGGGSSGALDTPADFAPPEVYDPRTQTSCVFEDALCPGFAGADRRVGHTASASGQGAVLVFGGADESAGLVQPVLLYDPGIGDFRELTNFDPGQVVSRAHHAAAVVQIAEGGNGALREAVLLAGGEVGEANPRTPTDTALLFDTRAETFLRTDLKLVHARRRHTLTPMGTDQTLALVAGGEAGAGLVDAGEIFEGDSFRSVEAAGAGARNGLLSPRINHAAVAMPDGVMVVGGDNGVSSLDDPEVFTTGGDLGTGFFALEVAVVPAVHSTRRGALSAWLAGDEVLFAGGERLTGFARDLLDSAEVLRMTEGSIEVSFSEVAPLGQQLSFAPVTVLPGGGLLFTGGMKPEDEHPFGPVASGEVWYYNP